MAWISNPLAEALDALDAACVGVQAGPGALSGMSDAGLLAVNDRVAVLRRQVDALHARVAAEIAARSRPELGRDGLARKSGHRTPAALIAAATGGHSADAHRLVQVGQATAPRLLLTGEEAPARHPHVAAGLAGGGLSVSTAAAITTMLDRIAVRVPADVLDDAERALAVQAGRLTLDEVNAVLRRAEAHLDPDGLAPRIDQLRAERSLKIGQDAAGMTVFTGRFDPETAAPIVAAIDAIVTAQLRTSRGHNTGSETGSAGGAVGDGTVGDGAISDSAISDGAIGDSAISDGAIGDSANSEAAFGPGAGESTSPAHRGPVAEENRSLPQLRADALAAICRHATACDTDQLPARTATTVIVRMDLADLQTDTSTGLATVDGIEQPLDAGTARRLAAAADIIPCVLGGDSEILDLGRARRHFTRAQRLALAERDGGCAFCHLPPGYTEAHHLDWWTRDHGPTDLRNGILLCTGCHHRIHDDGWQIRIEPPPGAPPGAPPGPQDTVWFIPPQHIDPQQTPRLGGRRRYDPLTWHLAA